MIFICESQHTIYTMPAPKAQQNKSQGQGQGNGQGNNQGQGQGKPPVVPPKKKRDHKTFEIRVYIWSNAGYSGDTELITTIDFRCKDVFEERGRPISIAIKTVEEYVRNIGLFGITVEDPAGLFSYYPPTRIAKVEYEYKDKD